MTSAKTRIAVVSGASSGIGAATARLLAQSGHRVVLVARGREALERVAGEIRGTGGEAYVEAVDVSEAARVEELAARVVAAHGVPDVVVNSAGAGAWRFLEDTTTDEARTMIGAPFVAAFHLTRVFLRGMIDRGSGVVIHVNSPASFHPWPGSTGYAAARWALRGLHEALRQDLQGTGVHSCHVVLGEVSSAYFENNPGSRDGLPTIGRIIPILAPERCAEIIAEVAVRPKAQVVHPLMLRLIYWTGAVCPWVVRFLVRVTGRRRSNSG